MIKNKITQFFSGHERTVKAKKNILASIFIKGVSIIVGFLMVSVVLNYLDQTNYGIWLTLSSFLTWFSFFEIGLGNGLRNKLAEALADKDYNLGKIYVSTTYAILTIVISIVSMVFFIANFFIDWSVILNTDKNIAPQLSTLALIIFGFFFFQFVMKLISIVLYADQRPAIANSFGPIGNFLALIVIYILTKTTQGSLIYLGWTLSVLPIVVLIFASIYLYTGRYNNIAPSFRFVKFEYSRNLLSLGVKFFIIQIAGLIIYQSSNIIIAQFFGPSEVTTYNIAYKYFSILTMAFSIITMPFWSAFTEAWALKDIIWIKATIRKLLKIWGILSVGGVIMLAFAQPFYHLWIGNKIEIPFNLSLVLLVYFITFTFGGVFNMFINGVGKIKLQMFSSIIGAIIFIITAIILIKYFNFGMVGLVIASILSNFYGLVLSPIQYTNIINGKSNGIWNK